jgi:DNA-binding NarL/FixJ family response regulator
MRWMITLMIVDDQVNARDGLRLRLSLEKDIEIVGEAAGGLEAIAIVEKLRPQVVVMDVSMPGLDGIEAARVIRETAPETAVILTTLYNTAAARAQAKAVGAGFVPKESDPRALLDAIRDAVESRENPNRI